MGDHSLAIILFGERPEPHAQMCRLIPAHSIKLRVHEMGMEGGDFRQKENKSNQVAVLRGDDFRPSMPAPEAGTPGELAAAPSSSMKLVVLVDCLLHARKQT